MIYLGDSVWTTKPNARILRLLWCWSPNWLQDWKLSGTPSQEPSKDRKAAYRTKSTYITYKTDMRTRGSAMIMTWNYKIFGLLFRKKKYNQDESWISTVQILKYIKIKNSFNWKIRFDFIHRVYPHHNHSFAPFGIRPLLFSFQFIQK